MNFTAKQKRSLFIGLATFIFGVFAWMLFSGQVFGTHQETCPEGNGWVKVDDLDGHNYTYPTPEGYQVTDNCYKHSTFVHFGFGDTVTTDTHNICHPVFWWICNDRRFELSHASFLLEEIPIEDLCENLSGVQESVPPNYVSDYGICVCPEGFHLELYGNNEQYEIPACVPNEEEEEEEKEQPKGEPSNETFAGSSTNPPAPRVCTVWHESPTVWYEGDQFKWATDENGIQKFSLIYGPSENELIYGIDNIPSDSRSVNIERPSWSQTWFQVWSFIDGCAYKSTIIDP